MLLSWMLHERVGTPLSTWSAGYSQAGGYALIVVSDETEVEIDNSF